MDTNRQIFWHNLTTTGTPLRGPSGVNQDKPPSSLCRFDVGMLHKLTPGHIRNAPVNGAIAVGLHRLNSQVLKHDQAEAVDQLTAFLVREVVPPVLDAAMDMVQGLDRSGPLRRPPIQLAHLALDSFQVLFISFHPTLPFDGLTGAEGGKSGQAQVKPNHFSRQRQRFWLNFTRKTSKPVAYPISLDGQSLDRSLDGPVQLDLDLANLGEKQPFPQLKPRLLKGEAGVPAKALEARIAVFMAGFDPLKEGLKSQVNPLLNVLQDLRMNLGQFRPLRLPSSQDFVGLVQAQGLLFLLPGQTTQRQSVVIDAPARFKSLLKPGTLLFGWKEAVLKCLTHSCECVNNSTNVLVGQIAKAAK